MACEPSPIDRSIQAVAFELALEEIARVQPEAVTETFVQDALADAILSLTNAGQKDPEMLARYAASRGQAAWQTRED